MSRELFSLSAEQAVLGSLLKDNASLDKVAHALADADFYRADHRQIFAEIVKQATAGKRADAITVADALKEQVVDCLPYLFELESTVGSAANIIKHAEIVRDRAMLRSLESFGQEAQAEAHNAFEPAMVVCDRLAQKLEQLAQCKETSAPVRAGELLGDYAEMLTARMEGLIKPISTGFRDLDTMLDGGLERGTMSILAARPGMGKTAMGLALARNVAIDGTSLFLSMEMSKAQVSDRNIAALGGLSVSWLRKPKESDPMNWNRVTAAFGKAQELNMFIDDQTSLSMLEIRAKARGIKRKHGLDLLVIDQLSFITGGSSSDNKAYEIGEHTRGAVALSKELDCAVLLLAQLNRDCEKRSNRRPIMADLAMSGSIEQDAANVIFLYRDEVYNPTTKDKGICEVITGKQRQGQIGTVGLNFLGASTNFADLQYAWVPPNEREQEPRQRSRGFD
jgi:replicative DNA helicase